MRNLPAWVSQDDIDRLTDLLTEVSILGTPANRDTLVDILRDRLREDDPETRFDVPRSPYTRIEVLGIVRHAAGRPGGLRALGAAVDMMARGQRDSGVFVALCREIAGREPAMLGEADRRSLFRVLGGVAPTTPLSTLFMRATEPSRSTTAVTLRAAVSELARLGSEIPLFRFLELVAADAAIQDSGEKLRRWIDSHLQLVRESRRSEIVKLREELLRTLIETTTPGLTVRLDYVAGDRYAVTAWLWNGSPTPGPNCGPDEPVGRADLEAWLTGVLREHAQGALDPDRDPVIEFVLPARRLDEPVDALTVVPNGTAERLGVRHLVSIRPDDRSPEGVELLDHRWTITARVLAGPAADSLSWLPSTAPEAVTKHCAAADGWAWFAITCPMMAVRETSTSAVLGTGVPIALWLRGRRDEEARHRTLSDLTVARQLDEVPGAVRAHRELGWDTGDDVRSDLVLLWDDPTRPPPARPVLAGPQK